MSARSRAQQERRARERAANESMEAASSVPEDAQVEFQPDPELSAAPADAEGSPRRDDDTPPLREFKRGNAERDSAMEELIASRQERDRELTESEAAAPTQEPTAEAPQTLEQAQPEPPKTVRVKIDGEESDVPAEEVEALGGKNAYQIIKAQEKRLAAINEMLREAKQIRSAQPAPPPEPVKKPEELIREAVAKIQVSTPEDGAAALAGVLQTYLPKAPDPQAITYQAMQLMRATDAEDRFIKDNADLIQNPLLKNLIISEKQRRLGEYQQKQVLPSDWNAFYNEIANDVRTAIGRPAPKPAPLVQPSQNPSGSADKEARKASITALPTASQRAPLQEEQKPPTRADLLNEMRKARGQPV